MKNTALKNFLRVEPHKFFHPQRRAGSRKRDQMYSYMIPFRWIPRHPSIYPPVPYALLLVKCHRMRYSQDRIWLLTILIITFHLPGIHYFHRPLVFSRLLHSGYISHSLSPFPCSLIFNRAHPPLSVVFSMLGRGRNLVLVGVGV